MQPGANWSPPGHGREVLARADLIVIYTERLDDCRAFYAGLGLEFVKEQHGSGPEHFAAELEDGAVLELYPAGRRPLTGRLRLGFKAAPGTALAGLAPGGHTLTDPDARTVVFTGPETPSTPARSPQPSAPTPPLR